MTEARQRLLKEAGQLEDGKLRQFMKEATDHPPPPTTLTSKMLKEKAECTEKLKKEEVELQACRRR